MAFVRDRPSFIWLGTNLYIRADAFELTTKMWWARTGIARPYTQGGEVRLGVCFC